MKIFNIFNSKKNEKVLDLLTKARVDFKYDKGGIKTRLLSNIEEQQMSLAEKRIRELTHKSFMRRHFYSSSFGILALVIVGTGAALAQADISQPGDRFHGMDQFGERILLRLPLTDSQKSELQVNIVTERNRELDYLLINQSDGGVRTEAVRQSQKSLNEAIDKALMLKENSDSKGKKEQSEKLDKVLTRLEALAQEQEVTVNGLLEKAVDEGVKRELNNQIEEIKKAKLKVRPGN